jgi:uncharacterized damage-inducible protein DinB
MTLRETMIRNLRTHFDAYAALIAQVRGDELKERLDAPKHKSLGEHLWCVIGSRESYARAITAGKWSGFSCSMQQFSHDDFAAKLASSASTVIETLEQTGDWTPERDELLLQLTEHEVMHEGQIIRHMYGMQRTLPATWRWA